MGNPKRKTPIANDLIILSATDEIDLTQNNKPQSIANDHTDLSSKTEKPYSHGKSLVIKLSSFITMAMFIAQNLAVARAQFCNNAVAAPASYTWYGGPCINDSYTWGSSGFNMSLLPDFNYMISTNIEDIVGVNYYRFAFLFGLWDGWNAPVGNCGVSFNVTCIYNTQRSYMLPFPLYQLGNWTSKTGDVFITLYGFGKENITACNNTLISCLANGTNRIFNYPAWPKPNYTLPYILLGVIAFLSLVLAGLCVMQARLSRRETNNNIDVEVASQRDQYIPIVDNLITHSSFLTSQLNNDAKEPPVDQNSVELLTLSPSCNK